MARSALLKCISLASLKWQATDHNAWAGRFTLLCFYSCRRQWIQMSVQSQTPKTKMLKSNKLFWFRQCKYYLNEFALSQFKLQLFLYVTWIGSRNPNIYSWNQKLIWNTNGAEKHKSSNKVWILNIFGFQMTFIRYIESLNLYPNCVWSWAFGLLVNLLCFLFSLLRNVFKTVELDDCSTEK